MSQWSVDQANEWYKQYSWLVGCNFLPSTSINQLEMFQSETFDRSTIIKELTLAKSIGFNSLRVYLHDLLWNEKDAFCKNFDEFLNITNELDIKPIIVLFDDCHRSNPEAGKQMLPVLGVHNSGWAQSPGYKIVKEIHDKNFIEVERLKKFVQEVLDKYSKDKRILMWDIYNEPGQFGNNDNSYELLDMTWKWAHEVRPQQPLTSCLHGSIGKEIIELNQKNSDIISFHMYELDKLVPAINELQEINRPIFCTEYMARHFGTTFEASLPIFKKHRIACYNWGLVAGKSQTHFGWETIIEMEKKKKENLYLKAQDLIPEPDLWFHDIFRIDGTAYDSKEIEIIKSYTK